jgi:hypothetical protein
MRRARRALSAAASVVAVVAGAFLMATPAFAAESPALTVNTISLPTNLPPGGEGEILLQINNLGDAPANGEINPIAITEKLPAGLTAKEAPGCEIVTQQTVHCVSNGILQPYTELIIKITVQVEPSASTAPGGLVNEVVLSGGGAAPTTTRHALTVSPTPASFGVEDLRVAPTNEDGSIDTQAGSHPFQLTTTIALNTSMQPSYYPNQPQPHVQPVALPKDLHLSLPAGLVGNPQVIPQCTSQEFNAQITHTIGFNKCPAETVIGVATVRLTGQSTPYTLPLFNLVPSVGEPAKFGFNVFGEVPVILDTAVRTGGDYGVVVSVNNLSQIRGLLGSQVTFWGVPADPRHNNVRGWNCLYAGFGECVAPALSRLIPILTLPTSCSGPAGMRTTVDADSWSEPGVFTNRESLLEEIPGEPLGLVGCNRLPFEPSIGVAPDVQEASTPTGLTAGVHAPQEGTLNPTGLAPANMKDTTVSLPAGLTLDPSGADGLGTCSEAQIGFLGKEAGTGRDLFTPAAPSCPDSAKIGTAEATTPILPNPLQGAVYLATPHRNPFGSLLAVYLVAEDPVSGVLVKQVGQVSLDPASGQLITTFHNIPDAPIEDVNIHFFGGDRAPLVTPPTCGPYTTTASFSPWSGNAAFQSLSTFTITSGLSGGPCPSGGTPPFHPRLSAGTRNNRAGSYSPLDIELTRGDSEQEFTHFSLKLPPGLSGKLAGIPYCSEAQVAAAKARTGPTGGQEELEHPSCPQASEIGHTLVGAGVGSILTYVPGKLYLAGPYHGSNLSVVSITAAKAGPFDLGTVVIRQALKIDPETAEVFVDSQGSDPIPHIIQGVPVHARNIQIYLDRPEFTLNPTSCERMSIASTVLGSGADFTSEADDQPLTVTSPFQAADCASLGFKPNLALSLKGGTHRGATPAFKAVLTYPKGSYANIGQAQVTLPHSEFLEQSHIGTVCTRVQFKEGAVPGEKCPPASIYGRARAITPILSEPLEGPVYLRSSSHNLPDLVAALHNNQVDFALDGRIDSVEGGRIRNTFETVPDAPVSKFVLEMQGGKKGLLVNSTNICAKKNRAISDLTGQNGKLFNTNPVLKAQCGAKDKKHGKHKTS